METIVVKESLLRIEAINESSCGTTRCALLSFLEELKKNDNREFLKIMAHLSKISENGTPKNIEKFRLTKPPVNGIYEIKSSKIRILCFFDGSQKLICTHAFKKSSVSERQQSNEISKAKKTKDEYFQSKEK